MDIAAAARLIDDVKPAIESTRRPGVVGGVGGFGALFDLKAAGFQDPILVSGTDGVGTKLKLAIATGRHGTVGIDLVAMCVNDLLVQGAEPLFFLDYFATGKLDPAVAPQILEGVVEGCRLAGCALLGGETAEMPGMYPAGDYDLAGFAVGAVERDRLIDGAAVQSGDILIGLPSSGAHSNGFSLIRRILENSGADLAAPAPFETPADDLGTALLTPTRIYTAAVRAALRAGPVHAMAHVTGGGLTENLPRVLPEGLAARVALEAWAPPPLFGWLASAGAVPRDDMLTTFNCGVGYVLIAPMAAVDRMLEALTSAGEAPFRMGEVAEARGGPPVVYEGADGFGATP